MSQKAQGEVYNQYTMSAAHKTLPLPTVVRVTNRENHKEVILLVDDRGPYKYRDRIIDLSVSAAKALGCYQQGVSKVRVTSLPKESHAFSMYLAKYGTRDRSGHKRTWDEVYRQEIGSKAGYAQLTPIPASERKAFQQAHRVIGNHGKNTEKAAPQKMANSQRRPQARTVSSLLKQKRK